MHVGVGHHGGNLRATYASSILSPHKRVRELTAILANGIHCLRGLTPVVPERGQIPAESSPTGLDPGARTRPDGAVSKRLKNGRSMNAH